MIKLSSLNGVASGRGIDVSESRTVMTPAKAGFFQILEKQTPTKHHARSDAIGMPPPGGEEKVAD
jgi:hypothetical protein